MLFFSIGLPSRFAAWCDAVAMALAVRRFGGAETIAVNTLEELAAATIRTKLPCVVASSRQPVARLQSELENAQRPFIVALGDPRMALRNLIREGCDCAEATRMVASSCASLISLIQAPHALVLSAGSGVDPIAVALAIAGRIGADMSAKQAADLVNDLSANGFTPEDDEAGAWQEGLGEREQAIVNGALLPYAGHLSSTGGVLEPLVWERELFFIFEEPPAQNPLPATRPVDVTGRARVLIYGPAINLPSGVWSAAVALGFTAETAGMSFLLDVYAGRQLSYLRIESPGAGIVEFNIQFLVDSGLDQRVEVRLLSERAAFDGRVALGQVTLTPQRQPGGETRDYLTQMLRN